jgi:hypothetical protein
MAQALTGPFGTPGVRGSIAGLTITQSARGKTVLKSKPMPTNPQSDAQTGNRGMFGWVAKQWADLAAEAKLSFDDLASAAKTSAFAQYSKFNADRWQLGKYPSQATPAGEAKTPSTPGVDVTKNVGTPDVIAITVTADADDWGLAIFFKNGGAPTGLRTELWDVRTLEVGANTINLEVMGNAGDQWGAIVVDARPA